MNANGERSIFSVDRFFLVHSISHKPRPKLIIPCARGTRVCPGHSVPPRVISVPRATLERLVEAFWPRDAAVHAAVVEARGDAAMRRSRRSKGGWQRPCDCNVLHRRDPWLGAIARA